MVKSLLLITAFAIPAVSYSMDKEQREEIATKFDEKSHERDTFIFDSATADRMQEQRQTERAEREAQIADHEKVDRDIADNKAYEPFQIGDSYNNSNDNSNSSSSDSSSSSSSSSNDGCSVQ